MYDEEWEERIDERSGKPYYVNRELKQTAWKKPTGSAEEKAAWTVRTDPRSGKEYYYNTAAKIRSDIKPVELTAKSRVPKEAENAVATTSRRHVSIRLGQLAIAVAENAPKDEDFNKLRALRSAAPEETTQDGNTLDLKSLAARHEKNNRKPQTARTKTFEQYAKANFSFKKKGMFGNKPTEAELFQYSGKPLKRSLLELSSNILTKRAVEVAKLIHEFCELILPNSDQIYSKVYRIVEIAMTNAPQNLRDEIFCQLMRHIRNNNDDESKFKGWQLMTVCCGNFPPSASLLPTLRLFIDERIDQEMDRSVLESKEVKLEDLENQILSIPDMAQYSRLRLDRCVKIGARSRPPSRNEVVKVMERRPVAVSVYLVNGIEIKMQVDTWTTIGDLVMDIGAYLNIQDVSIFALVEVSEDLKEYVLPVEDRVLDVVAEWEIEYLSHKNPADAPENQFLFRIRLFLPIADSDTRAIELAYYQAVYDVTDGRYPVTVEDMANLAALQLQEKFGDRSNQSMDPISTNETLCTYLPESMHTNLGQTRTSINEAYSLLEGQTELEAMKKYLELVQKWPSYGCQIFTVSPLNNPDYPSTCFIAINGKAVYIIDPKTHKFLTTFPWDKIVTWGYTDANSSKLSKKGKKKVENTFCLIMGNFMQQMKLFFKTPQAIDAYRLIEAYGNKIKGYKN